MTSIVPIIHEVEDDYRKDKSMSGRDRNPSVTNAPPFDERLVMIRKRFNHGIDALAEKTKGIDISGIQNQIDWGIDFNAIAAKENIPMNTLNYFISMNVLKGKREYKKAKVNTKISIYKLLKNNIEICRGTKQKISELTGMTTNQLDWLKTKRYGQRVSRGEYQLERVK